jgi:crossover junction endodeoxyribonuclease RusA
MAAITDCFRGDSLARPPNGAFVPYIHPDQAQIRLPYPPSVNSYWRTVNGRTLVSAAGRKYPRACAGEILAANVAIPERPIPGPVYVGVDLWPPDRARRDVDNVLKALFDAATKIGLIADDVEICGTMVRRCVPFPGGMVLMMICSSEP